MRFILLILVAFSAFAGDELPPAAKKIIDQRDAAIEKANETAIAALEKVLVDLTKKGDLDGALAVRAKIESLRKPETHDVLGQPIVSPEQAFLGKWNLVGTGEIVIKPKGVASCSVCGGKWSINDGKLVIAWANGYTDTFAAPVNGVLVGANNNGKLLKATAIGKSEDVVGAWKANDDKKVWTFKADGSFSVSNGDTGTWTYTGGVLEATCPKFQWVKTFTFDKDANRFADDRGYVLSK